MLSHLILPLIFLNISGIAIHSRTRYTAFGCIGNIPTCPALTLNFKTIDSVTILVLSHLIPFRTQK